MASVSKDSFHWILTHPGHVACVVVGGAVEALEARPGVYNLVLLKRKGFVKQALRYGYDDNRVIRHDFLCLNMC